MKHLSNETMSPNIASMTPVRAASLPSFGNSSGEAKAAAYHQINHEAVALAAAKMKCRKRLDLVLHYWPEDAQSFSRAMIEVGTAAAIALGDAQSTASLLKHLSRRIRAGDCLDF